MSRRKVKGKRKESRRKKGRKEAEERRRMAMIGYC